MTRYIIRRLFGAGLVVWIVSVVTFALFQLGPKIADVSPAYFYVGKIPPSAEGIKALEHKFGFDLPLWEQYANWVGGIINGRTLDDGTGEAVVHCNAPCLGYSFRQKLEVTDMIKDAIPVSLSLCTGAAILWLVFGVSIGTISALRRGSILDRVGMTFSLAGVSLPIFFIGPLLLLIFSYKLEWLPDTSYVSITEDPVQWLRSMILPWIALAFLFSALYARLTRANMLETMSEDYIRTARAKGLSEKVVVAKHGLRAALTPVVTIFGLDLGSLIGSTVITEQVFNLRGLGKLSIESINSQDLPVMMGVTIIAALAVVLANLLVDIVYAWLDPRVSYS